MNQYGYTTAPKQKMPLFDADFDGPAYVPELDKARLQGQIQRVFSVMREHEWLTLADIQALINAKFGSWDSEASISAQLRHLRKKKFGSYQIDKRRRDGGGLWEYMLVK